MTSLLGCVAEADPPDCGAPPAEPIHAFIVTTVTGENATDMDIVFCFRRKSATEYECEDMDTRGNNFDEWQTDVFRISVSPIAVGDLDRFKVGNTGGGFFESSWDMASLTVEAELESGTVVTLYDQPDLDVNLEDGEAYNSSACSY